MKGPKIENIRDPKWIGKKIIFSDFVASPNKLITVGKGQICTENCFGALSLWPIGVYDFHEWIEPEEEKKPEFPYKEPKKKKTVAYAIIKRAGHPPRLSDYLSESKINIKNFELDSTKILQFPAVTKNGTVLEFEVDDDS